jgi:uncharacterized protein YggE
MKLARIVLVAAVALAAAALGGVLQPQSAGGAPTAEAPAGQISVTGTGVSSVTPDRAEFSFGVVTQGKTAAAALDANADAIAKVVGALQAAGIAKADLQTTEVSVSPRTNDRGDAIVGYTATNTVSAKVRSLDRSGAVIDAAVGAGANQVSGPNLLAADQSAAYREALTAAVADARAKAQALAAASGLGLGRVTSVSESGATPVPVDVQSGAAAKSSVLPGTQEIAATVTVTYAAS